MTDCDDGSCDYCDECVCVCDDTRAIKLIIGTSLFHTLFMFSSLLQDRSAMGWGLLSDSHQPNMYVRLFPVAALTSLVLIMASVSRGLFCYGLGVARRALLCFFGVCVDGGGDWTFFLVVLLGAKSGDWDGSVGSFSGFVTACLIPPIVEGKVLAA